MIPYITFSAEQISHMPFYYIEDVYHKNQLGTYSAEKKVQRALTELGGLTPSEGDLGGGVPYVNFQALKSIYIGLMIHEKLSFTQFSTKIYRNTSLAARDLFPMSTQSINFYIFIVTQLKSTDV